jgi:transcriptional regulator with XRE-family HTH domain
VARSFSGARLRDERLLAGFTAAQLAARVGRTPSCVLKYEAGIAQPPIPVADALADFLGVSLDRLLADDRQAVA